MSEKEWDVFISHASEEKNEVARPLASALRRAGVKVWLDRQELAVGDSLSEKIDEGLSKSFFGIVILSKAFFSKHWPRRELAGLRSREEGGRKVILPIWHGVNKAEVREFSPILADAVAATTEDGIEQLATQVARVVFSPSSDSPSARTPSLSRAMASIMEGDSDRKVMVDFVRSADRIVDISFFGPPGERVLDWKLGNVTFDILGIYASQGEVRYTFSFLTRIWKDPFEGGSGEPQVLDEIRSVLTEVLASKALFYDHWRHFHPALLMSRGLGHELRRDGSWKADFRVFCGRRAAIDRTPAHTAAWFRLQKEYSDVYIRSYDAVLDHILKYDSRGYA
jgi:hypothetical protein